MRFLAGFGEWFRATLQDCGRWWIAGWAAAGAIFGYFVAGWGGALGFSIMCVVALFIQVAHFRAIDWLLDRQHQAKERRTAARREARRATQPPGEPPWWKQIDE